MYSTYETTIADPYGPLPQIGVFIVRVGGVAQWYNVGLWPANFPYPALDLQLMGDH